MLHAGLDCATCSIGVLDDGGNERQQHACIWNRSFRFFPTLPPHSGKQAIAECQIQLGVRAILVAA